MRKRLKLFTTSFLVAATCLAYSWFLLNWGADGYVTEAEREVAREQVRTLFKNLRPGLSHQEIRELSTGLDRLHVPPTNSQYWRIPTHPASLMAVEWVVSMEFDDKGKLRGAIVGTYDDAFALPPHPCPEELGNFTLRP